MQERRLSSSALAVSATIGVGDQPQAASSRLQAPRRLVAVEPRHLEVHQDDVERRATRAGEVGEARRSASSPSMARATSKPNRRSAFWAMRALMSLSSAMSARRAGADAARRRDAAAAAGGESARQRARTANAPGPASPASRRSP